MRVKKYLLAIRLLGFQPDEEAQIAAMLGEAPPGGPAFTCLVEDSLQDPDLYVVNGEDLRALAALVDIEPEAGELALIVGPVEMAFPCAQIARPLEPARLCSMLTDLAEHHMAALQRIRDRGLALRPERRRRQRLDFDVTDPALYQSRRRPRPSGAILIIDKGGALRDHVARLLAVHKLSIEWTDSAAAALHLCEETPVSVVLINTSTPDIDPYVVCAAIKSLPNGSRIAVVFLINQAFGYDSVRARAAGVRGLLDKPVLDRHMVSALKKLLSLPA
ncbi:response regulator [Massilia glaciei]|uniref:Response regulator n=1 Tax=Massilia glaciei TaxID=1524097 RepID=A0A2U2I5J9_9BURK|nr:response regulator [Massilia glaciei]PWF54915.1 response regulator [Massilia glaciei]